MKAADTVFELIKGLFLYQRVARSVPKNLGGWKPPLLGLCHLDVLLKVNRRRPRSGSFQPPKYELDVNGHDHLWAEF